MTNVYTLRPDTISNETVRCLAQLHSEARKGRVLGVGFVAYIEGHGFIANAAGDAYHDPNNTIGMLFALAKKLSLRVDGGNL